MNQLSNLLGDVYGDPDGPPVVHEPAADDRDAATTTTATPEWADDEHLDAAFENWQPSPVSGPLDADLAATLSAALVDAGDAEDGAAHELHAVPDGAPEVDDEVEPEAEVDEADMDEPEVDDEVDAEAGVDEPEVEEPEADNEVEPEAFAPAPPPLRLVPEVHNDASSVAGLYAGRPAAGPVPVAAPAVEETVPLETVPMETAMVAAGPWQRSDDDILPPRRQRGGLKLRRR